MKQLLYWKVVAVLNWFAARLLEKHQPKIIGITGSVGKTSTKRAVAAVVEQDYKTQWHDGNFNSEVGLPLALYELDTPRHLFNPFSWMIVFIKMLAKLLAWPYPYELLVLELGIDKPGDMDRFMRYITPDIGIVTAIQGAHLGAGLGSIDTVFIEKTKLAQNSKLALVNADDARLRNDYLKAHPGTKTYGTHKQSDTKARDLKPDSLGRIGFRIGSQHIQSQFIGTHSATNLVAGWAVGELLSIDEKQMAQSLEELAPYPGRMNALHGKNGSIILDDTYNNVSVDAAKTAIDTLVDFPAKGRKIAIIGTMNEMGSATEAGHRSVGQHINSKQIDILITIGLTAKEYLAPEATDIEEIHSFISPYEAGHFLSSRLKKGDVVLVKGSQNGVFAEEATALLLQLDSDRSKLVRQSARWQAIKHNQFN